MERTQPILDALIIGGGPTGLTAALEIMVPRNISTPFSPNDFRVATRENITSGYVTTTLEDVALAKLQRAEDGYFEAIDEHGKLWVGKKVRLAHGGDGCRDCWVSGIFHCLFCHGYEERSRTSSSMLAVGDLANAPPAIDFARNAHQLTLNGVTIYTNGSQSLRDSLTSAKGPESKIRVDSRTIARLKKGPRRAEVIIHFSHGSQVVEGFIRDKPKCQLRGTLAQQLGLELTPQGDLKAAPPFYQTSLPGIFTAGDIGSSIKIVPNALFTGAAAAASVAAQLQAEALGHNPMF